MHSGPVRSKDYPMEVKAGDFVLVYGYAKEVNEKGSIPSTKMKSFGFFNGCVMEVLRTHTDNGCTWVDLRDDYTAKMQEEPVRFWSCHVEQLKEKRE